MADDSTKPLEVLESAEKAPVQNVAPEIPKEKLAEAVRTYATDIATMMKREKGSIIKIALAEQERREKTKQKLDPTATKNIIVMIFGFMLIVGGLMIFIYSIVNRSKPVSVVNINSVFPSLFFTENQVQIDNTELNRSELLNAIKIQVDNQTLVPSTINNLFISYKTNAGQMQFPAPAFMQKLSIDIPEGLFQNLSSQYMLGVYTMSPKNNLFLVLKVKDFNETFNAMRDWETTMLSSLIRLFAIDTSSEGKDIFSKNFETVTLFNKEARVLKGADGKIILSYIFLDPKTVMITTDTVAVQEVLKRLNLQTIK